MKYRHLNRRLMYQWAESLVRVKGSEQQLLLLRCALEDNHTQFVKHVETSIKAMGSDSLYINNGETPSLLADDGEPVTKMTAGHMYLMPATEILALYQHWRDIPYVDAACPSLWGAITLAEIKEQRINPVWLAVHRNGNEETARMELASALKEIKNASEGSEQHVKARKKIDFLVRRIIRWMAGPGSFRGAVELYENCSLAKAWWCGYLSCNCACDLDLAELDVAQALQTIWLGLAEHLSGKLTIIAEPNMVNGIAMWANNRYTEAPKLLRSETEQVLKRTGEITSWCALGLAQPKKICETVRRFDKIVYTNDVTSNA